jgi:uncharacterized membrane protein
MSLVLIIAATFLAASVEWVEALTIVLAVGMFKGWRSSIVGTVIGLVALAILTTAFGLAITSHVDLAAVRTLVGVFLLLFGLKWLHKAILRSSGLKAMHDEAKAFEATKQMLVTSGGRTMALDPVGVTTALSGVFLEGLEVVFIVIALGGLKNVTAAAAGAGASLVVVVAAGLIFRAPLTSVPENTMKYVVGILLTSFGTFFTGEGIGVHWWNEDVSLLPLIAGYGATSLIAVQLLRRPNAISFEARLLRVVRAALNQVWGLFVDDGALATAAVSAILAVAVLVDHNAGLGPLGGLLLALGVVAAIAISLSGAIRGNWRPPIARAVVAVEDALEEPGEANHISVEPNAAAYVSHS